MSEAEHDLLRSLPEELRALYESSDESDPVRNRLFPRAYLDPTAEDAEREWRELVHPELLRERLEALDRLGKSLDGVQQRRGTIVAELAADEVAAWLGVLNDARLALGTRLGVTEDDDFSDLDPSHPDAAGAVAYAWLTHFEADLVEALLADLPD